MREFTVIIERDEEGYLVARSLPSETATPRRGPWINSWGA